MKRPTNNSSKRIVPYLSLAIAIISALVTFIFAYYSLKGENVISTGVGIPIATSPSSTIVKISVDVNDYGDLSVIGKELPVAKSTINIYNKTGDEVFEEAIIKAERTKNNLFVIIRMRDSSIKEIVYEFSNSYAINFENNTYVSKINSVADGNIIVLLEPITEEVNACSTGPEQLVEVGQKAYVCTNNATLRVRTAPSTEAEVIIQLIPGATFTIVEGPACSSDARWWRIRTSSGIFGWVKEGWDAEDPYFICPLIEGTP